MRIETPKDIIGKELFEYLRKNRKSIIKTKKSMPIVADKVSSIPIADKTEGVIPVSKSFLSKMDSELVYGEPFERRVVGNLCGWCDSYDDVSLRGSFNRTVNNNGSSMYFLHDHEPYMKAQIARNMGVSADEITLSDIGITNAPMLTQEAFVMRGLFDIKLDEKAYYLYFHNMVKEHSIKLQYIDIALAINDPDGNKDDYKAWVDYLPQVINRDKVEKQGFFYAIKEQKVFENSGVLWGVNSQTPVLDEDKDNKTTPDEPAKDGTLKKDSDLISVKNIISQSFLRHG